MAKVTMLLARAPGRPQGDTADRIELRVQLTPQGRIDLNAWQNDPAPWQAVRARPGAHERMLELVREQEQWALRGNDGDDAPLWPLDADVIRPGEIVTLHRPDGQDALFRIVAVESD